MSQQVSENKMLILFTYFADVPHQQNYSLRKDVLIE